MARPKKAPRERFQITLPKPTARGLRALAKKLDREISEVVDAAVRYIVDKYKDVPPGGLVVEIPQPKPRRSKLDAEYFKANPE